MTHVKKRPDTILSARKASFEYSIEKTQKAGLKLEGWQVKAIAANQVSASGIPYVTIVKNELFLHGLTVSPLPTTSGIDALDPKMPIKLLMTKREIKSLEHAQQAKGYTLIVNKIYWDRQFIKCDLCLAKGSKNRDKRQNIKDKDNKRQLERQDKLSQH